MPCMNLDASSAGHIAFYVSVYASMGAGQDSIGTGDAPGGRVGG
jgi:hypothetical protein